MPIDMREQIEWKKNIEKAQREAESMQDEVRKKVGMFLINHRGTAYSVDEIRAGIGLRDDLVGKFAVQSACIWLHGIGLEIGLGKKIKKNIIEGVEYYYIE